MHWSFISARASLRLQRASGIIVVLSSAAFHALTGQSSFAHGGVVFSETIFTCMNQDGINAITVIHFLVFVLRRKVEWMLGVPKSYVKILGVVIDMRLK